MFHLQDFARAPLDGVSDRVPVGSPEQQCLQDEHIEGTLQHVSLGSGAFGHDFVHSTPYDALVELSIRSCRACKTRLYQLRWFAWKQKQKPAAGFFCKREEPEPPPYWVDRHGRQPRLIPIIRKLTRVSASSRLST